MAVGCFSLAADNSAVNALLQPQKGAVSTIIQSLNQGNEQEATQALDALHDAVTQARALLNGTSFTGSADTLTDPFTLPAGTYRVHCKTSGYLIVHVVDVATASGEYIFNLASGDATSGASTLYLSDGSRVMLEFSNVNTPYELWFEKMS